MAVYASQLQKARVLLAEPNVALRSQLVTQLNAKGFTDIVQTGNMAGVLQGLAEGDFDVLIADTIMPEGDLCEIIWKLRHGVVGDNPFMIVITLIRDKTSEVVGRAVNAGADDVLLKPIDPEKVYERLSGMIRGRKRFVITTDYIGPDRRTRARAEGEEIPLIRVPNPLEMRTTGGMRRAEMRRVVEQAGLRINEEKVDRHVRQLAWLANHLSPHRSGENVLPEEALRTYVNRLNVVAIDLTQRIRTTRMAHVTSLCLTLERVARECAADPHGMETPHWNLLLRLLDALPRACDPARGGIAPRGRENETAVGISPLLDPKAASMAFGPGGRFTQLS